jgi:hypothetical protein
MAGKYLEIQSPVTYGYGIDNCGEGQAVAWDHNSQACYAIYGVAITISKNAASWQGGFEVCNFNWHMMDTRSATVTVAQLPGPILA